MSFVTMSKPTQGTATKKSQIDQLIDNDDALEGTLSVASGGITNGSFETGSSPDAPTGWEKGTTWGGQDFETTSPMHGAQSWKMVSTGAGGGELQSASFFPVAEEVPVIISFLHYSSVADIHNLVELLWYDKDQSYVDVDAIYDDAAANPTSKTRFIRGATPPATARYAKVKITGAKSDDATSGTAYWDDVILIDAGSDTVVGNNTDDLGAFTNFVDELYMGGSEVAGWNQGALRSISYAVKDVAGGISYDVSLRQSTTSRLAVSLSLPAGVWTVHAVGSWLDGNGSDDNGIAFLSATAIRQI